MQNHKGFVDVEKWLNIQSFSLILNFFQKKRWLWTYKNENGLVNILVVRLPCEKELVPWVTLVRFLDAFIEILIILCPKWIPNAIFSRNFIFYVVLNCIFNLYDPLSQIYHKKWHLNHWLCITRCIQNNKFAENVDFSGCNFYVVYGCVL